VQNNNYSIIRAFATILKGCTVLSGTAAYTFSDIPSVPKYLTFNLFDINFNHSFDLLKIWFFLF
jgi:hypothetical protein